MPDNKSQRSGIPVFLKRGPKPGKAIPIETGVNTKSDTRDGSESPRPLPSPPIDIPGRARVFSDSDDDEEGGQKEEEVHGWLID